MIRRRARRCSRGARGESLIEVLLALGMVAALTLELARVEIQQLRLRQALDLRLRAAAELDTFAEARRAAGERVIIADWTARVANALPEGRIAASTVADGVMRVEVSWRRARQGASAAPARSLPDRSEPAPGVACATSDPHRECLALVLPERPAAPTRAAGHTLLELLLAATLGGSVVTAALAVYQARVDAQARRVDDARMRMDGQAAIDLLRAYTRLAGYGVSLSPARASSSPLLLNCPAGARRPHALCLPADPGSDGLVVRYRADRASASESARTPSRLLDCGGWLLRERATVTVARIAVSPPALDGVARLHCRGPGPGSDGLVEGVERLRIRYWPADRLAPLDATLLGSDVSSVRALTFCVTIRGHLRRSRRGAARTGGYRDCDARPVPAAADGYARRTFTATVALRNADGDPGERDVSREDRP